MIQTPPTRKSPAAPGALRPATVAAVLGVVLLLVVLIGWRVSSASSISARPDLPVHAGMYNLREEMQRGVGARSQAR